ncbi:hypothetical protein CLOM_g7328 [Closterium sp. NIES-68]|nr:hypothetical protein CLOM_g7328 [Closterium sp. NIES-68]GJP62623.1 hypothetical protein CLOP_g19661 [Closterium sp. NIES-67]
MVSYWVRADQLGHNDELWFCVATPEMQALIGQPSRSPSIAVSTPSSNGSSVEVRRKMSGGREAEGEWVWDGHGG